MGGTQGGIYKSSNPKILPQIKKFIPKQLFFWKFILIRYANRKQFITNTVPTRLVDASSILGFAFFGAATIRVTTLQIHLTQKNY